MTRDGHVCNKIGTYLKALAAKQNGIPFYAAVPSPTIDWSIDDAFSEIPIEERNGVVTALRVLRVAKIVMIQDGLPLSILNQTSQEPEDLESQEEETTLLGMVSCPWRTGFNFNSRKLILEPRRTSTSSKS